MAAPACLGLWMGSESPIVLYRWLALLPLAAAALIRIAARGRGHWRRGNARRHAPAAQARWHPPRPGRSTFFSSRLCSPPS
ncbi:hypothetical protein ACTMU2_21585 [Cupriavidus basilensis]